MKRVNMEERSAKNRTLYKDITTTRVTVEQRSSALLVKYFSRYETSHRVAQRAVAGRQPFGTEERRKVRAVRVASGLLATEENRREPKQAEGGRCAGITSQHGTLTSEDAPFFMPSVCSSGSAEDLCAGGRDGAR